MPNDAVGRIPIREYTCPYCGRIYHQYERNVCASVRNQLKEEGCFTCLTWLNFAKNPQPHFQVINNQLFRFPPEVKEGRRQRSILTTSGEIIKSTELFNYGQIPERFRHLFPTTAHFIKNILCLKLGMNKNFECFKKGCWDRKKCYWYKDPEMDWNEIPTSHKDGDECCPLFINVQNPYGKHH